MVVVFLPFFHNILLDCLRWAYGTNDENRQLLDFGHHKKSCRGLRFSADGMKLYSVSRDKSLQVVDLECGRISQKIANAHK